MKRVFAFALPLLKLGLILFCVPFISSFLYLLHWSHSSGFCFVGPGPVASTFHAASTSFPRNIYGIYRRSRNNEFIANTNTRSTEDKKEGDFSIRTLTQGGIPSIYRMNDDLMQASFAYTHNSVLYFDKSFNLWCFKSQDNQAVSCITTKHTEEEQNEIFPPTGTQHVDVTKGSETIDFQISISCPAKDCFDPLQWLHTRIRGNQNLLILFKPATATLIAINLGLAFIYWNHRVDPMAVCKEYQKIVHDGELWRSFSGATAHFDMLHIGFNMMSLYALGSEIENMYGSLPFLFYNICLMPLTTIVMMGLVRLQIYYTGNQALQHTKTVGYSAVLFAWMVISSLERQSTCPIPFFPDACFNTHELDMGFKFRFNIGPIVQLFVAQMIMPRVSFIGHLAGIICGFLLHWNVLPREVFYSPQVLIPLVIIVYLKYTNRLIASRNIAYSILPTTETSSEVEEHSHSSQKSGIISKGVQVGVWISTITYCYFYNVFESPVIGQVLVSFLVLCSHRAIRDKSQHVDVIVKSTVCCIFIHQCSQAVLLSYVLIMRRSLGAMWVTRNGIFFFLVFYFFSTMSVLIDFICLGSYLSNKEGSMSGHFGKVFGYLVNLSGSIVSKLQKAQKAMSFIPFEGQGRRLGHSS